MERGNQKMKKVTLQDIANSIGVSRISVWKVFSGREGVSDELRKKVIDKANELNYSFPKDFVFPNETSKDQSMYTIGVAISNPHTSFFWMNVLHEVAKELTKHNANLFYIYLPEEASDNTQLPASLTNGEIDGLIVLNVYDAILTHKISQLKIPKVYLDATDCIDFEDLHGDLVLSSGKDSIIKIVERAILEGRTRIGFIGDVNYSKSVHERYDGFATVLNKNGLELDNKLCCTININYNNYESRIKNFLNELQTMPDAFICSNDFIAFYLWHLLVAKGYQVPNDIFISGFGGFFDSDHSKKLTSIRVFSPDLGVRLANQVLYKINNPSLRHETIHVSSEIVFGNSTQQI